MQRQTKLLVLSVDIVREFFVFLACRLCTHPPSSNVNVMLYDEIFTMSFVEVIFSDVKRQNLREFYF